MKQLAILFFFSTLVLSAQDSVDKQLETITTEEEALTFIENETVNKGEVQIFNEEKHKTSLAQDLLKKGKGGSKNVDRGFEVVHYKVLDVFRTTHYRAAIIMFDGSKSTLSQINETRSFIMKKYDEGTPFDLLARQYSKDNTANRGGDLGWFKPGTYMEDLEHKIISREFDLDDIFYVDIPDENKYYIVLKTHEPMDIKEVKVLKIVEPRS